MLPEALVPESTAPAGRPLVTDVSEAGGVRSFTLQFAPGQTLPDHRNHARITILVMAGRGILTVAEAGPRAIVSGDLVQLDPNVLHSVEASDGALELRVTLRANCCDSC
ncbi:MAG: cupin domain-containing protein [Gemmatimonadetes bacterium]|nr:cupin domain-containing protein [Gemmatimonadota bacterium]